MFIDITYKATSASQITSYIYQFQNYMTITSEYVLKTPKIAHTLKLRRSASCKHTSEIKRTEINNIIIIKFSL